MTISTVTRGEIVCPAWCTNHQHADDGDGYHNGTDLEVGRFSILIGTETLDGPPGIFLWSTETGFPTNSMPVDEAQAIAAALNDAVKAVRS